MADLGATEDDISCATTELSWLRGLVTSFVTPLRTLLAQGDPDTLAALARSVPVPAQRGDSRLSSRPNTGTPNGSRQRS